MATTQKQTTSWIMPVEFGLPFPGEIESVDKLWWKFHKEVQEASYSSTQKTMTVNFLTDAAKLKAMLPQGKGLELRGEPVVSVNFIYQGALGWLAGRSYDIVMVTFPVTFNGKERKVHGAFAPVIWENMTEPILAGRELLGWSKIYADIEPPAEMGNSIHCVAGWHGFKFLDLQIDNLRQPDAEEMKASQAAMASEPSEGSIHWKYIAKTGRPGEADADYLTISTNKGAPPPVIKSFSAWIGDGSIEFHKAAWQDLPTMANVVNAFADLEIKDVFSTIVTKTETIGGGMGETLILE